MKKKLVSLLIFPLCALLSLPALASDRDLYATALQGCTTAQIGDRIGGGAISVAHASRVAAGYSVTLYAYLNTDCPQVEDYLKSTLESGYTLVTLCPDRLTLNISFGHTNHYLSYMSYASYHTVDFTSKPYGDSTYNGDGRFTFSASDLGGFAPLAFHGDETTYTGFQGEISLTPFSVPSDDDSTLTEAVHTVGTIRYKYTVTNDGLTPITRYLTVPISADTEIEIVRNRKPADGVVLD